MAATLGLGAGGSFGMKKFIDREQSKKLKEHELRIQVVEERSKKNQAEIDKNNALDKRFREEFSEHKQDMKSRFDKIESGIESIKNHLMK